MKVNFKLIDIIVIFLFSSNKLEKNFLSFNIEMMIVIAFVILFLKLLSLN